MFEKKEENHQSHHIHYKQELEQLKKELQTLQSKVDLVMAKDEAQNELRSLTAKKIDGLHEEIGEVKELFKVIESEKRDLELKIVQTNELVKSVQPQQIAKRTDSVEKHMSVMDGKISLLIKQHERVKKELDDHEHKMKMFKGEHALLKMQEETKKDLDDIRKITHVASMHASKIENHFIKINEKAEKVSKAVTELTDLREQLLSLRDKLVPLVEKAQGVDGEKIKEIEQTISELTEIMTESFDELKANQIDPQEWQKMKQWLLHLIKKTK
jgi:chromosome segregation ATPase